MPPPSYRYTASQSAEGFRPNPLQELLLKAALMSASQALDAWHQWRSELNPEDLDEGSIRMLPLLYYNMRNFGIQDPFLNTCKQVYQATWYANETLFYRLRPLISDLDRAGIETMFLKGVALASRHYPDPGLRPMEDFDLLVHRKHAQRTIELLIQLGWAPSIRPPRQLGESYFDLFRTLHLRRDIMHDLDLHWRVLYSPHDTDLSDGFWDCALSIGLRGLFIQVPNDTDMLLHTCVHGARFAPVPPFRWVADAMMIMTHEKQAIDWDRLIHHAIRWDLVRTLRQALSYTSEEFRAPVPSEVLTRLYDLPVSSSDRIQMEHGLSDISNRAPMQVFRDHVAHFHEATEHMTCVQRMYRFPFYWQMRWRLSHVWMVPFAGISALLARIWTHLRAGLSRVTGKHGSSGGYTGNTP